MTERQILLVKNSWSYVIVNSEEAGQLFYQHLFEVAPGVRHMFKGDTQEQARKLMNMVTLIVTQLQQLDNVINEIKMLAQRHSKYGVKPEYYAVVGECLMWTLAQGLSTRWNDETEEAWIKVYETLANAMISGQTEAVAA